MQNDIVLRRAHESDRLLQRSIQRKRNGGIAGLFQQLG